MNARSITSGISWLIVPSLLLFFSCEGSPIKDKEESGKGVSEAKKGSPSSSEKNSYFLDHWYDQASKRPEEHFYEPKEPLKPLSSNGIQFRVRAGLHYVVEDEKGVETGFERRVLLHVLRVNIREFGSEHSLKELYYMKFSKIREGMEKRVRSELKEHPVRPTKVIIRELKVPERFRKAFEQYGGKER